MLTSIKKIFKFSLESISRNKGLFFTTTLIITITTSLISGAFLLRGVTDSLVSHLQEKVDISVYFNANVDEGSIIEMKDQLVEVPEIQSIEYISREEALDIFREKHKDNPLIIESLEEIGENPLVAHLNIKAAQASQYEQISSFLEKSSFNKIIDKVDYHQNKTIIERIFSISSNVEKTSLILIVVSAFLAVLIAFNTVRLGISSFKKEISIMRLVGASNWFIRGPFAVQGMLSAVLATVFSLLIFFTGCYFLSPKLEILITGFNLTQYFRANIGTILLIQLGTAMGLAVIPSLVAIRKYLHI
jgi:cell division transport system permease protein